MRLSNETSSLIPTGVMRTDYDRSAQSVGIVHFGIGAFHRAHQAVYTDAAMNAGETDWAITGVSLRSPDVAAQMNPQDGLYTVAQQSAAARDVRLIGAVKNVLIAARDTAAIVAALAAPTTQIISFTITEKGYCRTPGGSLDLNLNNEVSIYTYLTAGIRRRKEARISGLTLLSCDNLSGNGAQLKALMCDYLNHNAPDLIGWFDAECSCPSTMVDRIVPATTEGDRAEINAMLGLRDEATVITEPFSQWVIEDSFAGPRPSWEHHGVQIASDIAPYETAKLRMLNGAHSALAYLGLQRRFDFVHQAIADPELAALVNCLMRDEAASSMTPAAGQDLSAYADALIDRFKNSALNHRLSQIAMDGSQKIPQRWLETLAFHQQRGRQCPAILAGIAAWLDHVRGDDARVSDPMAEQLRTAWQVSGVNGIVDAVFGENGLIASRWQPNDSARRTVESALSV